MDRLYVLRHDKYAVMAANTAQALEEEGGIEIAFDLIFQVGEIMSGGPGITDRLCSLGVPYNSLSARSC